MSDIDRFRAETRAWLEANCPAPMRTPITSAEMLWSGSRNVFVSEDQRLWFERMRDRGWFVPGWPKEYGGGGLDAKHQRVLEQEMLALGCRQPQYNLGIWMLGPVLLELGSEQQKREHLPPMARGQIRWCQGFSEPNAGSDLASLRTSAVLDGDEQLVADTLRVLLGTPHGLGHLPLAAGDRVPPGVDHHPPGVAAPHDVSESNGSTVTLGITNGLPIFELHDPTSAR